MWSMERVTGEAALSLGEQKQQSHIERSRKVNAGKHLGRSWLKSCQKECTLTLLKATNLNSH